jgi:hypothetical protein
MKGDRIDDRKLDKPLDIEEVLRLIKENPEAARGIDFNELRQRLQSEAAEYKRAGGLTPEQMDALNQKLIPQSETRTPKSS